MPSCCFSIFSVSSMIVSVVRARKSIFSRPIFSTSVIGYIVVISSLLDLYSGTKSVIGCGEITTPAACVEAWRARPSRRLATSISSLTRGSLWTRALQIGILLERLVERDVQFGRNHLRDLVDFGIGHLHAAAGVADDAARRHGSERNDLRNVLAAVLLRDVVDDCAAAVHAEIDVDIGQRNAFGIQETFEQQTVLQRIDIRDPHAIRNQTSGGRTAARSDRDVVFARIADEIPDDQKISGILHLLDDPDFAARCAAS